MAARARQRRPDGRALNFFKHHIGDYASATDHLSWDEDMAYTRLLRAYYRDEKPLPSDESKLKRLIRCAGKRRDRAIRSVLNEFFFLLEDGWHNKRADAEIAKATAQAAANRLVAEQREAARLAKIANESSTNRSTNRSPVQEGVVNLSRLQTPDSTIQTPLASLSETPRGKRATATRIPGDFELTGSRMDIAVAEGVDPIRTIAKFVDYWKSASGAKARKLDWDATWRNWCRTEADRFNRNGSATAAKPYRRKTADELEAEEKARDAKH